MISCETCENRHDCKNPCPEVDRILWMNNRVMERHSKSEIVCFPQRNEIHFSELPDGMPEDFDDEMKPVFLSENCQITEVAVFIERFFNRRSFNDIAADFDVLPNTAAKMYADALKSIHKILKVLDIRRHGLKSIRKRQIPDDEKYFLLVRCFGFQQKEIAEIFGVNEDRVKIILENVHRKKGIPTYT